MSTTFTPGPWKVVEASLDADRFEIADVDRWRIVRDSQTSGYMEAGDPFCDARLIAAAPDMLAVLQLIAELPDATGAIAHAVVAKATGSAA